VFDDDSAKGDRAKRMRSAIDAKAGGKLVQLDREPEDTELALALTGKMMATKLHVWSLTRDASQKRRDNCVSEVAPYKGGKQQAQAHAQAQAQAHAQAQQTVQQQAAPVPTMDDGIDDIPF